MNFDVLTLANLHSILDSYGFTPGSQDILVWNTTNSRYEPSPLKTIGGSSIIGTGDIVLGTKGAVYAVDYASPVNINVLIAQTLTDGGALAAGSTVLLFNQTNKTENGLYVSSGPGTVLTRVASVELAKQYFFVTKGNTLFNQMYYGSNTVPPTIGTDQISISRITPQETLISGSNINTIGGNSVLGSGNLTVTGGAVADTSTFSAIAAKPVTLSTTPQPIFQTGSTAYEASGGHHIGKYSEANSSGICTYSTYTSASITAAAGGSGTYGYGRVWVFWLYDDTSTPDNLVPWNLCRVYKDSSSNMYAQVGLVSGTTVTWQAAVAITGGAGMNYVFDVKPVGGRQFVWVGSATIALGAAIGTVWCGSFSFNASYGVNAQGTDTLTTAKTTTGTLNGYYIADASHYYGPSATNRCIIFTNNTTGTMSWTLMHVYNGISHAANTTFANGYSPNTTYESFPSCFEFIRVSKDLGFAFYIGSSGNSIYYMAFNLANVYSNSLINGAQTSLTSYYAETISAYIPEASKKDAVPVLYVASSDTTTSSSLGRVIAYKVTIDAASPTYSTLAPAGMAQSTTLASGQDYDTSTVKVWCQSQNSVYAYFRNRSGGSSIWSLKYDPVAASFSHVGVLGSNSWVFSNDPYGRYSHLKATVAAAEGKITCEGGMNSDPSTGSTFNQVYTYATSNITYDLDKFSGITQVAITQGSSGTVTGKGGLVYDSSYTLTPGSKYYVKADATLSTTVNGTAVGYALTKNHLYLYSA